MKDDPLQVMLAPLWGLPTISRAEQLRSDGDAVEAAAEGAAANAPATR
ncbi:hypothetical protein [Streptomyces sp. NBC_00158]